MHGPLDCHPRRQGHRQRSQPKRSAKPTGGQVLRRVHARSSQPRRLLHRLSLVADRPSGIVPYRAGADGQMRPYLWLVLTGPYGGEEILITGLVDTGADRSVLPIDYAQTLGYKIDDLAPAEIGQVEGSASGLDRPEALPSVRRWHRGQQVRDRTPICRWPQRALGSSRPDDELQDRRVREGPGADPGAELSRIDGSGCHR
jgi:hypothetical protein